MEEVKTVKEKFVKPTIYIEPRAFLKLKYYIRNASGEISGLGKVKKVNGNMVVYDMMIYDQVSSSAHTELDEDKLATLMLKMIEQGEDLSQYKLWFHSHGSMGVFWSGTDQNTIHQLSSSWMISIVGNKKFEFLTRLDIYDPVRVEMDELPLQLYFSDDPELEKEIVEEIKLKVKEPAPVIVSPQSCYGDRVDWSNWRHDDNMFYYRKDKPEHVKKETENLIDKHIGKKNGELLQSKETPKGEEPEKEEIEYVNELKFESLKIHKLENGRGDRVHTYLERLNKIRSEIKEGGIDISTMTIKYLALLLEISNSEIQEFRKRNPTYNPCDFYVRMSLSEEECKSKNISVYEEVQEEKETTIRDFIPKDEDDFDEESLREECDLFTPEDEFRFQDFLEEFQKTGMSFDDFDLEHLVDLQEVTKEEIDDRREMDSYPPEIDDFEIRSMIVDDREFELHMNQDDDDLDNCCFYQTKTGGYGKKCTMCKEVTDMDDICDECDCCIKCCSCSVLSYVQ